MTKQQRKLIGLICISFLLGMVCSYALCTTVGRRLGLVALDWTNPFYTTAYEGAKGTYFGATWSELGLPAARYYDHTWDCDDLARKKEIQSWGGPTLEQFDTDFKLDVDWADKDRPNIIGEMTAVLIPEQNPPRPDWVDASWWVGWTDWEGPVGKPYEWNITNSDGTTSLFHMEEWKTKWFISLEGTWDTVGHLGNEESRNQLKHLTVWMELETKPVWYFENQTTTYFAIAKIELDQIKFGGRDNNGKEVAAREGMDVVPESVPSLRPIYKTPFGSDVAPNDNYYRSQTGQKLNPEYWCDKVYTHVGLENFGCQTTGFVGYTAIGDVVTMGFTVTQFVVGEWKVQDIGDIPDDYGRRSQFTNFDPLGAIWSLFSNPIFLFFLLLFGVVILLVLLAIFAPGVLHLTSALAERASQKVRRPPPPPP